jgi:hypothetical protein
MFKMDLKFNGRSIRPDQLAREMEKAMLKKVEDSVKKTVSRIRCRTHGQHARVSVRRATGSKMNFDVSGCCDELIDEVRKQLH